MLTYYMRRPRRMHGLATTWGYSGGSRLPVDIVEDDDAYRITAAVPGLKADDVEIQVLEDVVTLRVKAERADDEDRAYLVREIRDGGLERTFRLPLPVDPERALANVEHGLLRLDLPKAETVRPKLIKVSSK